MKPSLVHGGKNFITNIPFHFQYSVMEGDKTLASAKSQEKIASRTKQLLSSYFTIARFGPDTLVIFCLLAAGTAILLSYGMVYFSFMTAGVGALIFLIESLETISLGRAEYRQIVGEKCVVLKRASKGERGIVRLFTPDGGLEQELWSAEASSLIEENKVALVTGMRSVILEIAPI